MDQDYDDTDINKNICEAVGCPAKATDKIAVKVGTLGVISLLLCGNCKGKFQDDSAQETNKLGSTTKGSKAQARCEH